MNYSLSKKLNLKQKIESVLISAGFYLLGRGLQSTSRFHSIVKNETDEWKEGFTAKICILNHTPFVTLQKKNGCLQLNYKAENPDLTIYLKTLNTGFRMIISQASIAVTYSQNKIRVEGDIKDAMKITRCINVVLDLLFPQFLSKHALKKNLPLTFNKIYARMRVYLLGITFGL